MLLLRLGLKTKKLLLCFHPSSCLTFKASTKLLLTQMSRERTRKQVRLCLGLLSYDVKVTMAPVCSRKEDLS